MNDQTITLLIRRNGGEAHIWRCDGAQALSVRDLSLHVVVQIRAWDISPYRHALHMDGVDYDILNVRKPA